MTENDSNLREDVLRVIRRWDPSADQLRDLADDLESLADRYDAAEAEL